MSRDAERAEYRKLLRAGRELLATLRKLDGLRDRSPAGRFKRLRYLFIAKRNFCSTPRRCSSMLFSLSNAALHTAIDSLVIGVGRVAEINHVLCTACS